MDILITDVTEMHGDNYCVAGWDTAGQRLVRPLPDGNNWSAALLEKHKIEPGVTIQATPQGSPTGRYPHLTEDILIDPATIAGTNRRLQAWFGAGAPPSVPSLSDAFQHSVHTTGVWDGAKKGAHVQVGTRIGSLSALKMERRNIEFFENNYRGEKSLRAYMSDSEARYSLPVVARSLRELYRAGGSMAVNQSLPSSGILHVRVGLARPWRDQPDKCTVMINGVYW